MNVQQSDFDDPVHRLVGDARQLLLNTAARWLKGNMPYNKTTVRCWMSMMKPIIQYRKARGMAVDY